MSMHIINELLSQTRDADFKIKELADIVNGPENQIVANSLNNPDLEVCYSSSVSLKIGTPVRLSSLDTGDETSVVVKSNSVDSDGLSIGIIIKSLENGVVVIRKKGKAVGIIDENGTTGKDGSSEVPTNHYTVGQRVYATDNADDDTNNGVVVPDDSDITSTFSEKYSLGNVCSTIRITVSGQFVSYIIFDWAITKGGGGGTTVPVPTAVGQILQAEDNSGLEWVAKLAELT